MKTAAYLYNDGSNRDMYNNKEYSGSLQKFEQVIKADSSNYEAREFAGIVALQMSEV